nr:uncharacterized protein LOC109157807 [Ipomoea batatas]
MVSEPLLLIRASINGVATSKCKQCSTARSTSGDSDGNPYFIHSNESPAMVLVTPVLDGSNYYPWARAMRIALLTKNKLAFINGSITVPDKTESRYETWERCNNLVVSWIVRSTAPEIGQTVLWKESAIDVWKDLEERFSEGDIFRISQVQGEIYQSKQGILNANQYFSQMKLLWDELMVLRPLPVCTCTPKCSCGGYEKFYTYVENDHLSVFLRGLNETYAGVKSQIMMMNPLPSVGRAFSLVKQQERECFSGSFQNNLTAQNVHDRVPTLVLPTHLATSLKEGNSLVEPSQNDDLMNIDAPSEQIESAEPQTSSQQSLRKSGRERTKPSYLQDYVCAVDVPKSKKTSPHVLSKVLSYDRRRGVRAAALDIKASHGLRSGRWRLLLRRCLEPMSSFSRPSLQGACPSVLKIWAQNIQLIEKLCCVLLIPKSSAYSAILSV